MYCGGENQCFSVDVPHPPPAGPTVWTAGRRNPSGTAETSVQ